MKIQDPRFFQIFEWMLNIFFQIPKDWSKVITNFPIMPGTQWCGNGNIAPNNDSLGFFKDADYCCREHDHCPDFIVAKETKHELKNDTPFTLLNCECDELFYKCLKNKSPINIIVKALGIFYFDIYGPQCFKYAYPIIKCEKFITGRCVKYKLDTTKTKQWQWFDNKIFTEDRILQKIIYNLLPKRIKDIILGIFKIQPIKNNSWILEDLSEDPQKLL